MRMSRLFSQTLRENPSEAEMPSHQLLLRSGFIRQLAAGIYAYLPLARRSLDKIEAIFRQEMNAIGGQELTMPVVHPAELWQESGRWYSIDSEMTRFKDRSNRDLVLAMTHEEIVADLVRREIRSHRQLPCLIYHIQTKWRDDPRPRGGLIRVREFTMKDSYSLDADWEGLDRQYRAHYAAYYRIFNRCGIPVTAVKADTGMMGGQLSHEFMYLDTFGEDTLLCCDRCGYSANRQVARFHKEAETGDQSLPLEKIATPGCKSITELAAFLNVNHSQTAKAVFMIAAIQKEQERFQAFVFAVVRGDMELNETKLANVLKARDLRPATEAEIRAIGAEPGYASPLGIQKANELADKKQPILVVVDDLIPQSKNLVSGANEPGFHFINVNYGRDYEADIVEDIAAARSGDPCPECWQPLKAVRGVEVGNIFKLGTRYSETFGCYYRDGTGNARPIIMGSYGIGSGRLLACIAEEHHDDQGLKWPISIAPFHVHLVLLMGKKDQQAIKDLAVNIYNDLTEAGVEVLFDDRTESPGVKFNDADLIGVPLRLTVSERLLAVQQVELKRRDQADKNSIPVNDVVHKIREEINKLKGEQDWYQEIRMDF
jgi:prolyl-tRNA synthetase